MGNTRAQEIFVHILNLANAAADPGLQLTKIAMQAEAALEEIRAEQRHKEDQTIHVRQTEPLTEDANGMVLA